MREEPHAPTPTERVVLDQDGVIVEVNQAWLDYGLRNGGNPHAAFVGTSYLNVCDADSHPQSRRVATMIRSALQGESPPPEVISCHPPNDVSWFEVTAVPAPDGVTIELTEVLRTDSERPPAGTTSERLKGSKCSDAVELAPGLREIQHAGCPGWWHDRQGGWACSCPCHERRFGWPSWLDHDNVNGS